MILKECLDFVKALGECRPGLRSARLAEAAARLGDGPFEAALFSDGLLDRVAVRAKGGELEWSLTRDERLAEWTPANRRVEAAAFSTQLLSDPAVAAVLADFAALCRPESLLVERRLQGGRWVQSARWGLRLARPEPWPQFVRFSLADPLLPQSSRLAHLAAGRGVREVWFEGAALTVYLGS